MARVRLDDELVAQGICENRADALRTLMAGLVSSNGERLTSPGMKVAPGLSLHVKGRLPYVGRGGVKLAGALDSLGVDPRGLSCLDVGCSTGGFTDCLLKRGAATVVAVDVGRAQGYEAAFDLAVCDVSFTSVRTVLPAVLAALKPCARFLTLVKPQFEAPAEDVGEGGVVRDPAVHRRVLADVIRLFAASGLAPHGVCASPITGAKGNREFFLLGVRGILEDEHMSEPAVAALIERAGEL